MILHFEKDSFEISIFRLNEGVSDLSLRYGVVLLDFTHSTLSFIRRLKGRRGSFTLEKYITYSTFRTSVLRETSCHHL